MAEFKIERIRYRWRNVWTADTFYSADDVVIYNGQAFVSMQNHTSATNFYTDYGSTPRYINVTVAQNSEETQDVFFLNGKETPILDLREEDIYTFDLSDPSNLNHDFSLSTSADGIEYTTQVTKEGTPGTPGAKLILNLIKDAPTLFYYCKVHTGMGETSYATTTPKLWDLMFYGNELKGEWQVSTFYSEGNLIKNGGTIYRCIEAHTSVPLANLNIQNDIGRWEPVVTFQNWRNNWTTSTVYLPGDTVKYNGRLYLALTQHTSATDAADGLELNQSAWTIVNRSDSWQGNWQAVTNYLQDDIVRYGGIIYRCTNDHVSSNLIAGLELDSDKWEIAYENVEYKGNFVESTRYKKNDIVKSGGSVFICVQGHTSSTALRNNDDNWNIYIPGVTNEPLWSPSEEYSVGDLVRYGGYVYTALENNINAVPSVNGILQDTGNWELLVQAYYMQGDWDEVTNYRTGDVVRASGILYSATVDNVSLQPNDNPSFWKVLVEGDQFRSTWIDAQNYFVNDIVLYAGTAYIATTAHISDSGANIPNNDTENVWSVFIQGGLDNVLVNVGDLKTFDGTNPDTIAIGDPGTTLVSNGTNPVWQLGASIPKVYYVEGATGQDGEGFGSSAASPFKTIKFACDYIQEDLINRAPATILISTGLYEEILPISVPADVALVGDELRSTTVTPAAGYEDRDMFYVRNGSGIRNMSLQGLVGSLGPLNEYQTRRPTAGAYVSLDPGNDTNDSSVWIISRSPYIQNVSTFGEGCIGMKVDGDLHNGGNKSIVANDFTQVLSDGIGYWVNGEGRSELVSVFTYFCHIGYLATNGGKVRATNGNNSYGDYGCVAEGFNTTEEIIEAKIDNRTNQAIVDSILTNTNEIMAVGFLHAGGHYTNATFTVEGSGLGATAVINEFTAGALTHIRVDSAGDSSAVGGSEYQYIVANAISGNTTQIELSTTDSYGTPALYENMRIIITDGAGVGQFGIIDTYNDTTKIATIIRESDGQPGWDHLRYGYPIAALLNTTTRYEIQPRVIVDEPPYANNSQNMGITPVDIAHGKTKFVAIRTATSASYTTDGINWNSSTLPSSPSNWDGIVGNDSDVFGIYSSDSIGYSTDGGENWALATESSSNYSALGYGATWWIALNVSGQVFRTNDIVNAAFVQSSTTSSSGYQKLTYGNGFWIASVNGNAEIDVSGDDGSTWTTVSIPDSTVQSMTFGNGMFVGVCSSGEVIRSYNATTWYTSANASSYSVAFSDVSYANGLFSAVGNSDRLHTSVDGNIWRDTNDDTSPKQAGGAGSYNKVASGTSDNGNRVIAITGNNFAGVTSTGAKALVKANWNNGRIDKFIIYNTGSGYNDNNLPTVTVYDNANLTDVVPSPVVQDSAIGLPLFTNRGQFYTRATATITGDGYAELFQLGNAIYVSQLTRVPGPGDNLVISGIDDLNYYITSVEEITGSEPELKAKINIYPAIDVAESPEHDEPLQMRQNYSQIRLTGHDFLDIGTGSKAETDYPGLYVFGYNQDQPPAQFNEVVESATGRVFYTSTDQDGNFRVGELFRVDQASGVVTVSASQFDLTGLTELSLGGIQVGGSAVVIREFSKDGTFVANSDNIVPTQAAIIKYLQSRISGGTANIVTTKLTAGTIIMDNNDISSELTTEITAPTIRFSGGVDGTMAAWSLFGSRGLNK